jgi:glucuronate isomerase
VIASDDFSARNIITKSNVSLLCTTDDPVDSLEYHDMIADDKSFKCFVLPAFRPDNALSIEKPGFADYINRLSEVSGIKINSLDTLKEALFSRIEYFKEKGCVLSDHGLLDIPFNPISDSEANTLFKKRLNGIMLTEEEVEKYQTSVLLFLHAKYKEVGFVSQLHYGCKRDNNTAMFEKIGPNTGFDCISSVTSGNKLADLLNLLNSNDSLSKMIVYSLNPNDNDIIDTVISCFQTGEVQNKIQHGSAWWFNDNKTGMEKHLNSLANNTNLSGFVGMLTD